MKHKKKTKKKSNVLPYLIIIGILIYIAYGLCVSYVRATTIRRSNSVEQQALETHIRLTTHGSIPELIDYIAPQFNQSPELIKKIAYCEANYRHFPVHDGGQGIGTTGILKTTFNGWTKQMGRTDLRYESNYDQIYVMAWAFSQGEHYRDDWTTYVAYKKGGTYTFIDRHGVKHTARCK